jgi:hypothetical protein
MLQVFLFASHPEVVEELLSMVAGRVVPGDDATLRIGPVALRIAATPENWRVLREASKHLEHRRKPIMVGVIGDGRLIQGHQRTAWRPETAAAHPIEAA